MAVVSDMGEGAWEDVRELPQSQQGLPQYPCNAYISTTSMGLLLSLPLAGVLGTVGSSCLAGLAFCFTSTAGLYLFSVGRCSF